jgi:NAD-dependent SIR2 family protein deacetylase
MESILRQSQENQAEILFGSRNMFSKIKSVDDSTDKIKNLKNEIENADAIVIGAGAGLSTSAGFIYTGERFQKYFQDFADKYHFEDMYSGGFYPYGTLEEHWAYWSRYIYVNRYMDAPKPLYDRLFELVKDRDYFVLTTNVDHCFQKAGFDKKRLFYTQGDYGLFQCSEPCHDETYDNEEMVRKMVEAQGFIVNKEASEADKTVLSDRNILSIPDNTSLKMNIPSELVPLCPKCGKPMSMNLRADSTFVEDEGWHRAAERYQNFLRTRKNQRIVYLELGVGYNTPGIIKYPFWQMTMNNPKAAYACLNYGEAYAPEEIAKQSVCINGDIGDVLEKLKKL